MIRQVDCIVIGGGPAGTFCAAALAKYGMDCVLLEKRVIMQGKVCGGGISRFCVHALEQIGYPIAPLLHRGAKIERTITVMGKEKNLDEHWQSERNQAAYAIGISRDVLDELFLQSAISHGVDVRLDAQVSQIEKQDRLYIANEYAAPKVVLACGASNRLLIGKTGVLPAGISAIYQSDAVQQGTFLFDRSPVYADGYGWIFSIGNYQWNVGVWSRRPRSNMKELYQLFSQRQVPQFLGEQAVCVQAPKGALIGAGVAVQQWDENIYLAGDAVNSARLTSGEGIPQAILSGIQTAETVLKEWRRSL